ncbi:hypothetical protein [Kytococcus sedentarius]|uniref:hypothetical protein n=1 Tax=Kytococcus sedentarius TaxID=1276 RepID=UPI0035BC1E56
MPSHGPSSAGARRGSAAPTSFRGQRAAARAAALSAVVLALAGWAAGPLAATAAATVAGAIVALGWGRVLDLPSPRGTRLVLGVVVALGVVAAVVSHVDDEPFALSVWWALPVAGGVWASLAHQVWRSDGRPRVVDVLTAEVFAVLVITAGFLWSWATPAAGLTAAAGLAATALVDSLAPRQRFLAWAAGALVGLAAAGTWWLVRDDVSTTRSLILGLVAVLAPTISQAARLVLLRLPAVRSGVTGGVVVGVVSASLAGIVTGLFAMVSPHLG